MLACQQNVPAPSKVKGAVMMDVTGEQTDVGGVEVRVGVSVEESVGDAPIVGVLEAPTVAEAPTVLVGVRVAVPVIVRVGEIDGVSVRVWVSVGEAVTAEVLVAVAPLQVGSLPHNRLPLT